jgi:hypothetical protein
VEVVWTQRGREGVCQRHRVVSIGSNDGVRPDLRRRPQYGGEIGEQRMIELDGILAGIEIIDGVVADARRQEVNCVSALAQRYLFPGRDCRRDRYGAKQPVGLVVDAISEIQGVGAPIAAPHPEVEGPKGARCIAVANVYRDRAIEGAGRWVKGIDLAVDLAFIADQQVAAELTETGGGESDAPRRGEDAADHRLLQGSALIENRHRSFPEGGSVLGIPGQRIGHIDATVDVPHVERIKSKCAHRGGRRKCASAEAHRGERAVEDVDAAGPRIVGCVQFGP